MAYDKKTDPTFIVNRFYELKRSISGYDSILINYVTDKYYYTKIANEYGYRPDTIRKILIREIHGIDYFKRTNKRSKKGGRK